MAIFSTGCASFGEAPPASVSITETPSHIRVVAAEKFPAIPDAKKLDNVKAKALTLQIARFAKRKSRALNQSIAHNDAQAALYSGKKRKVK